MIVGVHPLAGFDKVLHYRVPEPMRAEVQVGSLVRVPILNTLRLGVVGEVGAPRDFPVDRLKAVVQVAYPFPAFTPELLELARWMARYYACGIDSVIETMIPAAVRRGAAIRQERLLAIAHRASAEEIEALARRAPQQARLYGFLAAQVRPQPSHVSCSCIDSEMENEPYSLQLDPYLPVCAVSVCRVRRARRVQVRPAEAHTRRRHSVRQGGRELYRDPLAARR